MNANTSSYSEITRNLWLGKLDSKTFTFLLKTFCLVNFHVMEYPMFIKRECIEWSTNNKYFSSLQPPESRRCESLCGNAALET